MTCLILIHHRLYALDILLESPHWDNSNKYSEHIFYVLRTIFSLNFLLIVTSWDKVLCHSNHHFNKLSLYSLSVQRDWLYLQFSCCDSYMYRVRLVDGIHCLRGLNLLSRSSALFFKANSFYYLLFAFLHNKAFWKGSIYKMNRFVARFCGFPFAFLQTKIL